MEESGISNSNVNVESLPTNQDVKNTDESSASDTKETEEFVENFFDEPEDTDKESKADSKDEVQDEADKELNEHPKAKARVNQLEEQIRGLVGDVRKLEAEKARLSEEVGNSRSFMDARTEIENSRISASELEEQGLDPQDAQLQSILLNQELDRQERELANMQQEVADLQNNLQLDYLELMRDYPVYDESSSEFDPDFTQKAITLYQQAARLQFADGMVISAEVPMYEYMSSLAEMRGSGIQSGERTARKNINKQNAEVFDAGGTIATKENDTDAFVKSFWKD